MGSEGHWSKAGLLLGLSLLSCAAAPAKPAVTQPRSAASAPPSAGSLLVEVSGDRVQVAGQLAVGDEKALGSLLAERSQGVTELVVRAQPGASELALARVVNQIVATQVTQVVLDLPDLHWVMARRTSESVLTRPQTTVVAQLAKGRHVLWGIDNSGAGLSDLGGWTPGDAASEQAARAKLEHACAVSCRFAIDISNTPLLPALRNWHRLGGQLEGSVSLSVWTPPPIKPSTASASAGQPTPSAGPITAVSGRLPPALIQAVVRGQFDKFRTCYERGLARDAQLEGSVQARFVIGRDGNVSNVSDGGSTIPDSEVRDCVLKSFYDLKFPPPEGGIVTVVYPIMLAPG